MTGRTQRCWSLSCLRMGEKHAAGDRLEDARAAVREEFQPRRTANNLWLPATTVEPDGTGWRHDVAAALARGFAE